MLFWIGNDGVAASSEAVGDRGRCDPKEAGDMVGVDMTPLVWQVAEDLEKTK